MQSLNRYGRKLRFYHNKKNTNAFYKHSDLEREKIENAVEYSLEDGRIILTAKEYIHTVELEDEAIFEDNGFSMLKGEKGQCLYVI